MKKGMNLKEQEGLYGRVCTEEKEEKKWQLYYKIKNKRTKRKDFFKQGIWEAFRLNP